MEIGKVHVLIKPLLFFMAEMSTTYYINTYISPPSIAFGYMADK